MKSRHEYEINASVHCCTRATAVALYMLIMCSVLMVGR